MESRDLRTCGTFQVKSVRRSLDSLCSLGMTSFVGPCDKLQFICPEAQKVPAGFILPGLTVYLFLLAFAILRHMTMPKIIMAWDRP